MAISFIGSATGTNTATMPAHQAGDLLMVASYRFGSNTAPTAVGGWTSIVGSGSGTFSRRIAYKFAASSSEVVGTWTNADLIVVHVYRGVAAVGSFDPGTFGSAGTTITYAFSSTTPQQNIVTSWIVAFGAVQTSTTTTVENAPAGMTARQNSVGASGEIASFDTNAAYVGKWPSTSVALGESVVRTAAVIELVESPRAVTMQPGSYALSGPNTPVVRPSPISFIGAATGTDTATIPAHQAGDLIIVSAFNATTTTAIALPSGFTTISSGTAPNRYRHIMYKIAASSSETIPTMANCTICAVSVYRGVRESSPVSGTGTSNTGSVNATYAAVTMNADGRSWVYAVGLAQSTTSNIQDAPARMTQRATAVDATSEIATFDTNGGTTVWNTTTVAIDFANVQNSTVTFQINAPQALTITADPGAYALSGADTFVGRFYTITADPGSYMLSGADTAAIRSLLISGAPGSYTLSGANTLLDTARYIIADPGSYNLSGADTSLQRSLIMSGAAGSYALSGANTAALRSVIISAASGSYTLSGANTTVEKGYVISAEPGSYSINGADTSLIRAMYMVVDPGSYVLSGADTGTYAGRVVNAEPGSYAINGSNTGFELTVTSIRLKRYVGGVWETNRLKQYKDGDWVKPNLKRYVSGVWVPVND